MWGCWNCVQTVCSHVHGSGNRFQSFRCAFVPPLLLQNQLGPLQALSLLPVVAARLSGSTVQAMKILTVYGKVSAGHIMAKSSHASLNAGWDAEAKAKTHFGLSGPHFLGAVLSGVLRAMVCYINQGDKCQLSVTGIHCRFPPWTALMHGQNNGNQHTIFKVFHQTYHLCNFSRLLQTLIREKILKRETSACLINGKVWYGPASERRQLEKQDAEACVLYLRPLPAPPVSHVEESVLLFSLVNPLPWLYFSPWTLSHGHLKQVWEDGFLIRCLWFCSVYNFVII